MDFCRYDTSIDAKGKEILRRFFSDFLTQPCYTSRNKIYFSIFSALEGFIAFHISDRLKLIINNYYDKLLHLFRDRKDKDLRHKVLRCLGRLSYICQENNDTATTKELYDLFVNTFFDLSENPTIARARNLTRLNMLISDFQIDENRRI